MGTRKMQHRRSRRARARGAAPLIAFAMLFAFALGQGGSLVAFAFDNSGAGPTVSKDGSAPTSGDSGEGGSSADGGTAKVSGSGPAATSSDSGSTATGGAGGAGGSQDEGAQAAPQAVAAIDPGDVNLDFVAAGPFTYDHDTGLGTAPQFGYDDRNISKTNGVVESLEGGDFECNDLVTFFVEVEVEQGGGSGDIELDLSFGNETTGQPGLGFDNIVSYGINIPDGGNVGLDGDESVSLSNEHIDTTGYDELKGTFTVSGLEGGETAIVRVTVHLECGFGTPTGNILNEIDAARTDGKTINVGQETVPMKQLADVAQPGLNVNKTCPATAAIGDTITYTIDIVNTGNETLDILSVVDTVNGHAGVNITSSFPDTVAAGATVSAEFEYTVLASDPDPLPNSVAVQARGVVSQTNISGNASCETDIVHVPGIDVTKSCPAAVENGEVIEYTVTIENTGNEALTDVTVMDTLLGDITGDFDVDLSDPFPAGAVATAVVTYQTQAGDDDPLTNTVTASGTGADSGTDVTDTASCVTDILNPAIDIVKTVSDETVAVGDTVTYTYVVTNTGDTTLFDITVDDDVLGHIGDIAVLEPGESATLTADFVVGDEVVRNIAIARGHDILGRVVEASDDAVVTPVLATTPPPVTPPTTPFTGSDAGRLGLFAALAFGTGLTVVAATRRRRSGEVS